MLSKLPCDVPFPPITSRVMSSTHSETKEDKRAAFGFWLQDQRARGGKPVYRGVVVSL
jgi:hypothetical protein